MKNSLFPVLFTVALTICLCNQVFAQETKSATDTKQNKANTEELRSPQATVAAPPLLEIDSSTIKVDKRPAIPFTPINLRQHLKNAATPQATTHVTGQAAAESTAESNDEDVTLPDGTKMKVSEVERELNALEEQLNAVGHSIKDAITIEDAPQQNASAEAVEAETPVPTVAISESILDTKLFASQQRDADFAHIKLPLGLIPFMDMAPDTLRALYLQHERDAAQAAKRFAILRQLQLSAAAKSGKIGIAIWPPLPETKAAAPVKTFSEAQPFKLNFGDPQNIAATFTGKLEQTHSINGSKILAEAILTGSFMGKSKEVLRASATAEAASGKPVTLNVGIDLFGNRVYNLNQSDNEKLAKDGAFGKGFEVPVYDARFMLGPIPMRVKVGLRGNANLKFYGSLQPALATIGVEPSIQSDVYAQAAVDIVVLKAGVEGTLLFFNDKLNLKADGGLKFDAANKSLFWRKYSATNTVRALDGTINLFAEIGIKIKIGFIKIKIAKRFTHRLFKWNGFSQTGVLFDKTFEDYIK